MDMCRVNEKFFAKLEHWKRSLWTSVLNGHVLKLWPVWILEHLRSAAW
jgi:hypothetical protein